MQKHLKSLSYILLFPIFIFTLGLIHPWLAFFWEGFLPLTCLVLLVYLLVSIIRLIISAIKRKNVRSRTVGFFKCLLIIYIFFFQSPIVFYGVVVHYKLAGDYEDVRAWADSLPFEEDNDVYLMIEENPECVEKFNAMYVHGFEIDGKRQIILSWASGLMAYSLRLTIAEPDMTRAEIDFPEKTFLIAKIDDGVYLSRHTY